MREPEVGDLIMFVRNKDNGWTQFVQGYHVIVGIEKSRDRKEEDMFYFGSPIFDNGCKGLWRCHIHNFFTILGD